MILNTGILQNSFNIQHLRNNIHETNTNKGNVTIKACLRLLGLCLRFFQLERRLRPRLVYTLLSQNTSGFLRDACFIWIASLMGSKTVAHFHGGQFKIFYYRQSRWMQKFINSTLCRVAMIIVLAHQLENEFDELLSAPPRIRVLYNGVSLPAISRKTKNKPPTILYLGTLSTSKGSHILLKAARRIKDKKITVNFICAGEKLRYERNVFEDSQGNPLPLVDFTNPRSSEGIQFLPPVHGSDKERLLEQVDVLVLPSFSEGFPVSTLEAMAHSLPLIVTPVGAFPEVLKEGENCLFVRPGSVEDLVDAFAKLAADADLRTRMGQANRRLVEERFTVDKTATALRDILQESMELNPPPPSRNIALPTTRH